MEQLLGAWVAIVSLLVGSALTSWVGRRGADGSLERNHVAGVRTSATLASDEAWDAAHRAASPMTRMTGDASVLATVGAAAVLIAGASPRVVLLLVLVICLLLLGGVVVAAVTGHRAALRALDAGPRPDR